jgi:hypothetical protein
VAHKSSGLRGRPLLINRMMTLVIPAALSVWMPAGLKPYRAYGNAL